MVWYRACLWQQLKAGACRRFESTTRICLGNGAVRNTMTGVAERLGSSRYLLNVRASRRLADPAVATSECRSDVLHPGVHGSTPPEKMPHQNDLQPVVCRQWRQSGTLPQMLLDFLDDVRFRNYSHHRVDVLAVFE